MSWIKNYTPKQTNTYIKCADKRNYVNWMCKLDVEFEPQEVKTKSGVTMYKVKLFLAKEKTLDNTPDYSIVEHFFVYGSELNTLVANFTGGIISYLKPKKTDKGEFITIE